MILCTIALTQTINQAGRISAEIEAGLQNKAELHRSQKRCLESLLGVYEKPEDDLEQVEGLCTEDSCEWFTNKKTFQRWRDECSGRVLWITAKPATGKSYVFYLILE